jgi:hypothetical protein
MTYQDLMILRAYWARCMRELTTTTMEDSPMAVGEFRKGVLCEMLPNMGIYQSDPPDHSLTLLTFILADLKHHAARPSKCHRPWKP